MLKVKFKNCVTEKLTEYKIVGFLEFREDQEELKLNISMF